MEWKLKSGGWKSISINVAKKSRDGATINGCSSRKELLTAHAGTPLPGIRVVGCATEDVLYPASVQNYGNRLVQNLEVPPEGPGSYIFQIES
jgi:hypothetical protein